MTEEPETPRMRRWFPFDGDDVKPAGVIVVLIVLAMLACATIGLSLGLGVRLFWWVVGG